MDTTGYTRRKFFIFFGAAAGGVVFAGALAPHPIIRLLNQPPELFDISAVVVNGQPAELVLRGWQRAEIARIFSIPARLIQDSVIRHTAVEIAVKRFTQHINNLGFREVRF